MSIASAIVNKQQQVASCYTAISNKGGTLPATQDVANMPTAINSIPTGGGGGSKYGCTIDNLLGNVDANGVLQYPSENGNLVFTGVQDITENGLSYKFYGSKIQSVSFPDLKQITGAYALSNAFAKSDVTTASFPELLSADYCSNLFYKSSLESVSFPKLATVIGGSLDRGLYYAFSNTKIESLEFPELTTIVGNSRALAYLCYLCTSLKTVRFSKLATIPTKSNNSQLNFNSSFVACIALKDIYFNAVNSNTFTGGYTNVFNNMFHTDTGSTATGGCTVHFPSNMQSTIAGLTGYPTFGGSANYINLAFDLPSTQ